MAKSKVVQANERIADEVAAGYKKIEDGVVGGYKKIEEGAVEGFNRIADKFVDNFLTREGESVEEAKERLAREQRERSFGQTAAGPGKPKNGSQKTAENSMSETDKKAGMEL